MCMCAMCVRACVHAHQHAFRCLRRQEGGSTPPGSGVNCVDTQNQLWSSAGAVSILAAGPSPQLSSFIVLYAFTDLKGKFCF